MPRVVVSAAFDLARAHWQKRLTAVERLDLAFLINAEHDRVLGWGDVKTDDVAYFFDEKRIGRELECLRAMRLQSERTPDSLYTRNRNACRTRHPA